MWNNHGHFAETAFQPEPKVRRKAVNESDTKDDFMKHLKSVSSEDLPKKEVTFVSVAKDACYRLFAMCMPKQTLFEEDVREKQMRATPKLFHEDAAINLEKMTHSSLLKLMSILYVSIIFCIGMSILIAGLGTWTDTQLEFTSFVEVIEHSTLNFQAEAALYGFEGIMRTFAGILSLWLLIAFPQRCIWFAYSFKRSVLPEQIILAILVLLLNFVPSISIAGIVVYWMQFQKASEIATDPTFQNNGSYAGAAFRLTFLGIQNSPVASSSYSIAMIPVQLAALPFAVLLLFRTLGSAAKSELDDEDKSNHSKFKFCVNFLAVVKNFFVSNGRIILLVSVYFIVSISLSFAYDFTLSLIPFVGLVTVIKVCVLHATCDTSGVCAESVGATGNSTVFLNCEMEFMNGVPYSRAVSVTIITVFELFLLVYVHYQAENSKSRLQALHYRDSRSHHLSFKFFRSNRFMMNIAILVAALISTIIPSARYWEYRTSSPIEGSNLSFAVSYDPLFSVGINYGIIGLGPCALLLMIWLMSVEYAYLPPGSRSLRGWCCPSQIDMDLDDERELAIHPVYYANDIQYAAVLEYRRSLVLAEKRKRARLIGSKDSSHHRKDSLIWMKRFMYMKNINGVLFNSSENLTDDEFLILLGSRSMIAEQVNSYVFVLETEILQWMFAHIIYDFGFPIEIASDVVNEFLGDLALTHEEKQEMVDDERIEFIAHITHAETDTHCGVFLIRDDGFKGSRIHISFRGTVSSANVKTDMDIQWCLHPGLCQVEPREGLQGSQKLRAFNDVPLIHRGFMLAYGGVRVNLLTCIDNLLDSYPEAVIFCSGHSLGGGLAVVCATDLSLSCARMDGGFNWTLPACDPLHKYFLKDPKITVNFINESTTVKLMSLTGRHLSGVQSSTFGGPRMGNYSLVTRLERLITKMHRFVVQSDVIPKMNNVPSTTMADMFKYGFQHAGVEILMDLECNIVIGPSFIERKMLHGWKGISFKNHFRSSYSLAIMLWAAKVHGEEWVPGWWKSVIELVLNTENKRIERLPRSVKMPLMSQLMKEGVTLRMGNFEYTSIGIQVDPLELCESSGFGTSETTELLAPIEFVENDVNEIQNTVTDMKLQNNAKVADVA